MLFTSSFVIQIEIHQPFQTYRMLHISYLSPSILISKGPSLLREKPLSARSICMEEQPASNRTASMLPGWMFMLDSRTSSSLNRPSNGFTRPLEKGLAKGTAQLHVCISVNMAQLLLKYCPYIDGVVKEMLHYFADIQCFWKNSLTFS